MRSFTSIATEVAEDVLSFENPTSAVKRLLRQFTKFIEMTGGTTEELKNEKGQMLFDDNDVPLLKFILTQLAQEKGFAFDFLQKKVDLASIEDTHNLIQQMLDSMATDGLSDDEAQAIVNWLDRAFQFSFRLEIENCHRMVDSIAANMLQYPYTHSMIYVNQFHQLLQREFARITVEAIMNIGELAEFLQMAKDIAETDSPSDLYGEEDDAIKSEYCQRDSNVVAFLDNNPEIRRYVERRAGATVEEIWGIRNAKEKADD